jgi:SAM-dependent methyltransferase
VSCNKLNPALDAAEFLLEHPYQTGDLRPEFEINLWIPLKADYETGKWIGRNKLSQYQNYKAEKLDYKPDSITLWDELSDEWARGILNDKNHLYLLHPTIINELGSIEGKSVLDFGCGSGGLTRKLTAAGELIGLDPSTMLDIAIDMEKEFPLGIKYLRSTINEIQIDYANHFDWIIANAVIMDLPELDEILTDIKSILKNDGNFLFTVVHPCFNSPVLNTVRLPRDSERNEDRIKVISSYFNEGAFKLSAKHLKKEMIIYHRTISTYLNALIINGWKIEKIIEPTVNDAVIATFPRHFKGVHEYLPMFFGVVAKKVD